MKVFFDTVGCRLNQAEIEQMAAQLRQAGHEIVKSAEAADTVIINSCAVTAAATSDSRQKVRQAYHKGVEHIVVTGCWATLNPEQVADLEGVSEVVSNLSKMNIPLQLINVDQTLMEIEPIARQPLPGARRRTRAFIKVQDGCNNACTFCVTRLARGNGISLDQKEILAAVNQAVIGGAKEIVLTGVNLGSWGKDLAEAQKFSHLLGYLLDHSEVERIRLSSIEPWDIDSSLVVLWENPRLCPHFHLPLQSGSPSVLRRMARNTTPEKYRQLVELCKARIPNLAITTDVIVGFPGETDFEFEESIQFIHEMGFAGGHVFKYSSREGTAAARMQNQISGVVARGRAKQVREVFEVGEIDFMNHQIGSFRKVIWESTHKNIDGSWTLQGLSENYSRIRAEAKENRWNILDSVKVLSLEGDILIGEILF